ncbi:MAG: ABC transporter substrate-binding protein [Chloroflexi bacterium]|nr:ABC transporter substrate-binding protein [Chloroflexota bacterium]
MHRVLVLLLSVALGGGCAPAAPTGAGAPAPPAVEQVLRWGTASLQPSLDPNVSLVGGARRYDVFETLVVQEPTGKTIAPQLARGWRLVGERNWEFTLFTDRRFQDDSPLTAEDVVFSYQRSFDPAKRFTITTRIPTYESVAATDRWTVVFTTRTPDPIFPKRTASVPIFSKAAYERLGEEAYLKQPIGSGPMRVRQFVPDDRLVLEVWPDHPTRKLKLQTVIVRHIPDPSQRVNGLRTGELDYVQNVPLESYERLKAEGFHFDIRTAGYSGSWGLDAIKDTPLKDRRVRLAINYAVDKEAVSKLVYAGLAPIERSQVTQPEAFGFDPTLQPIPYDPAKAKQLLAEAGYPNGFKIQADVWMASSEIQKLALFLQQQLKDVGIEMEINGYTDVATFLDKGRGVLPRAPIYNGAPAIIPQMDAEQALTPYLSAQPLNIRRMENPNFDRALLAASREMDPSRREQLLQEAARILAEEVPVLFLVQQTTLSAWSPKVRGIIPRIPDDLLLDTVEKVG